MSKPPLDDVMDYGKAPDMGDQEGADPGTEAASVVREAISDKDDAALYDALCSIVRMEMSKEDSDEGEMEAPKKPSLSMALLRGK